VHCAYDTVI